MPRPEQININYTIDDSTISPNYSVDEIIQNFEDTPSPEVSDEESETSNENLVHDDLFFSKIKNYELNYTAKQLGVIYEYYNIGNPNKLKKIEIAQIIVAFEHDKDNMEVVERRKTLWFYMTELKSDPFTKKYVWSP